MAKKSKVVEAEAPIAAKSDSSDDWETKNHARTIIEAHEIMNDKHKMKKVKKHLKAQKKAIDSIDALKKYSNDKYGAKEEMMEGEDD